MGRMNLLYVVKESSESLRLARQKDPFHAQLTKSKIIVDKSFTRLSVEGHFSTFADKTEKEDTRIYYRDNGP